MILRQQSVPPIYATCFSKRTAILQQKCEGECNITLKWSFTYAKPLWIQHTIPLKNAFVCLRKLCSTYIQCLYKKKVLHWGALPYLSGLILIYSPPPRQKKKNKTKISQLVQRPEPQFFCFCLTSSDFFTSAHLNPCHLFLSFLPQRISCRLFILFSLLQLYPYQVASPPSLLLSALLSEWPPRL